MKPLVSAVMASVAVLGSARAFASPALDTPVVLSVEGRVSAVFSELGTVQLGALDALPEAVPLILEAGAKLTGLCADLSPFSMLGPDRRIPQCPPSAPRSPLSELAPLRGTVSPLVPRVLSPRTGYVRELGWIQWQPVADRSDYRVELLNDRFAVVWSQAVEQTTQVLYPSGAPRLEAARFYTVRVSSGGQSSDAERADLGFQLLPPQLLLVVEQAERTLARAKLSATARSWLRGLVLRHFQLRAEAATVLGARPAPAFELELGETFRQLGLVEAAAAAWRRVLTTSARGSLQQVRARAWLGRLGLAPGDAGKRINDE